MLFENLRNELKNKIAPAYTMAGSDVFLINKAIELILEAAKINAMNVVRLDEDAQDDQINATLVNTSMFGDKVAVVIRGTDKAQVIFEQCKKNAIVNIDCKPMSEGLVVKMIMQNKKFAQDAATALARACENNFSRVSGEMEKILNYYDDKEIIDATDVNAIVTKTEKYQVFELSSALMKKDAKKVQAVLENLESSGTDEYAVFASLLTFFKRLFYIKNSKMGDGELSKYLGIHPYAIIAARRDGGAVNSDTAMQVYEKALDYEYQIKSGKILANRATMLLIGEML